VAITVEEKFGRGLSDQSAELTYIVRGTDSDIAAHNVDGVLAVHAQRLEAR